MQIRLGEGSLLVGRLLLYLHIAEGANELCEVSLISTSPIHEGFCFRT